MNQFFIFLHYHFLDYFEKFACTFPCYTFLTLFHICNTFVTPALHICYTLTYLLHHYYTFVTPLLHVCNTRFSRLLHPVLHICYTVVTLIITILMHSYSVAFCPVFVLWHFVRVWFVAFCPVAFCPGFVITLPYIKTLLCIKTLLHIKTLLYIKSLLHIKTLLYIKTEIKFNTLLNTLPILIVQTNVIVILNMYALKVYNVHIELDSVYCVHCTLYRKSALFRHFLAVFSLYRELCDVHKVDWAWTRTL